VVVRHRPGSRPAGTNVVARPHSYTVETVKNLLKSTTVSDRRMVLRGV
jgi:hypothetical protein